MENRRLNIGPTKGRIIRRASKTATVLVAGGAPLAVQEPVFNIRRGRYLYSTYLLAAVLFLTSAYASYSRPSHKRDDQFAEVTPHLVKRYEALEREYSTRFSSPRFSRASLTSAASPQFKGASATIAKTPVVHHIPLARSPREIQQPGSSRIEEQIYLVLKKYGKQNVKKRELARAIVQEAAIQNYDPMFVAAVIKSESAFDHLAKSHKGAVGLMQLMPATGAWLAQRGDLPRGSLTDPGRNLKLGITYLKELEREYKGNRVLTLIAYNWGPGHVESASSGKRKIPVEVMQYAVRILNDYRRWASAVG